MLDVCHFRTFRKLGILGVLFFFYESIKEYFKTSQRERGGLVI